METIIWELLILAWFAVTIINVSLINENKSSKVFGLLWFLTTFVVVTKLLGYNLIQWGIF